MSQIPPNLGRWIQRKLDTYKEKPRRGVPKGKPYGIPKRKYHAALLHLAYTKTFNLKAIAKEAGVSYSVLANWRIEDRFIDLIRQAIFEYSQQLIATVFDTDSEVDSCRSFTEEELDGYSVFLVYGIMHKLSEKYESYQKEALSLKNSPAQFLELLLKMLTARTLLQLVSVVKVKTWGNKEIKINFYEYMAQTQSFTLKIDRALFGIALKNDWKNGAQQIFDLVSSLAEGANLEVISLRKTLIERGLDTVIMEATNKKSREG